MAINGTGERVLGQAVSEAVETVLGDNPYFPAEQQDSPSAQSAEGQAGDESSDGDDGQTVADQAQGDPEPTFDVEADKAAGINVESTEYKHFQAAFTKLRQADKAAPKKERDFAAEIDALKQAKALQDLGLEQAKSNAEPEFTYSVDWKDFKPAQLGQDNPLAGHEASIVEIVKPIVERVMAQVNAQSAQYVNQQRLVQTRDYLTNVVDEIGKQGGDEAKAQALDLLKEHIDIAKSSPQKWAKFVVGTLGLTKTIEPAAAASSATPVKKIVQQAKSIAVRPSAPSSAGPKKPEFKGKTATRDAVLWAMDQAAAGKS